MPHPTIRRSTVACGLTGVLLVPVTAHAQAGGESPATTLPGPVPELAWSACGTSDEGTAAGVECAVAELPLDYDDVPAGTVGIAVARVPATDPANRIGSLFFNFGGPGGPSVDYLQGAGAGVFAALNERFDIVGFDPRGVGQSVPDVDCQVDQETEGLYPRPAPSPVDLDADALVARAQRYVDACLASGGPVLEHLSTANVARDMDVLRAAVGDEQLTYLGFSYGTFLGATYAALFPDRYRALVLDGALDPEAYIHRPTAVSTAQVAGFEQALGRFSQACAVDQTACSGFGGTDPLAAFDALLAAAATDPIPAPGYAADPRPVTADDIRDLTSVLLYAKQTWPLLAAALAEAAAGDGSAVRALIDQVVYPEDEDGSDDPSPDRFFAISAGEQEWPADVDAYLARGAEEWAAFPHFWSSFAYAEIPYALWPIRDEDAYGGPFTVPESSPTPLVIGTTYDPATPYRGSIQMVEALGNARLLTMEGDGHTAYGGNSACVDGATETYLVEGTLPPPGTVCDQEVPFTAPEPAPAEVSTEGGGTVDDDVVGTALATRR